MPEGTYDRDKFKDVIDRIDAFCNAFPGADYGPGHIALADYNLLDDNIEFCLSELDKCNDRMGDSDKIEYGSRTITAHELRATDAFLREIRELPIEQRDVHEWRDEFDDE